MLRVGLTGGLASGKSTVAGIFRELGAHVVDADRVAREVVPAGSALLERLARAFGREILRPDGTLDRARLGAIVFADPARRRVLEGMLHPVILAEIDRRVEEWERRDPGGVAVVEATLILEVGRQAEFDKVVVVWADEDSQVRRAMARDGLSREEALQRLGAQMPLEEKRRRADFAIDNSGSPERCRAEAERVWAELVRLAGERRR